MESSEEEKEYLDANSAGETTYNLRPEPNELYQIGVEDEYEKLYVMLNKMKKQWNPLRTIVQRGPPHPRAELRQSNFF